MYSIFLLNTDFHAQHVLYTSEHRPAGLNWQELHSPHFRIIFASVTKILHEELPVFLNPNMKKP